MKPLRPIGHINGSLSITGVLIATRLNWGTRDGKHQCWLADDGCIFLAPASHPTALAVARTAPDQVINTYQRAPSLKAADITDDLQHARTEQAVRVLNEARHA